MSEIHKRILTSICLFSTLYFSLINKFILAITLFIVIFVLFEEFDRIFFKIFNKQKKLNLTFLAISLCYILFFSLIFWTYLDTKSSENIKLILFILFICISTDIGGFLFGKIFKGKKLTKISPNKTYSGMFGSFILSYFVAFIFFKNIDTNINFIFTIFLISSFSQIGDLFISYLKRKAKIKDTGNFLPGHGGLLDRLDGILLAFPIGIFLVTI